MKRFPAECKADFRVEKRDIPLLLDALRVWMASWSYIQNITELKEGIKTHKQVNVINREMQRDKRRGKYAEDSCIHYL